MAYLPVKILGLEIQSEDIGTERIQRARNVFGVRAQISETPFVTSSGAR